MSVDLLFFHPRSQFEYVLRRWYEQDRSGVTKEIANCCYAILLVESLQQMLNCRIVITPDPGLLGPVPYHQLSRPYHHQLSKNHANQTKRLKEANTLIL